MCHVSGRQLGQHTYILEAFVCLGFWLVGFGVIFKISLVMGTGW